jgi:hypothetical protein
MKKLLRVLHALLPAALLALTVSWCANALKGEAFAAGSTFLWYLDPVAAALGWTACKALVKSMLPFLVLPCMVSWLASTSQPFWQRVALGKRAAILAFLMLLSILADGLKGEAGSPDFLVVLNGLLRILQLDNYSAGAKVALLVIGLAALAWILRHEIENPLPVRTLKPQGSAQPHPCLVMAVSPNGANRSPTAPPVPAGERPGFDPKEAGVRVNGISAKLPHPEPGTWQQARKNIEALDSHETRKDWKWMMLLRAIYPHLFAGTLSEIVLLGSPGEGGSFDDLDDAKLLIQRVVGSGIEVHLHPEPVEFEDFERLREALRQEIGSLRANGFAGADDIMLDTSAGFKTASITAALLTLDDEASFQYVHTNGSIAEKNNEIVFQLIYHNPSVV